MLIHTHLKLVILFVIFRTPACHVICQTDADCLPGLDANTSLVRCESSTHTCNCTECVEETSDGACLLNPCFSLVNSTCSPLDRRSKTVTLVLAVLFTSLGAANFYIWRWPLGCLQLGITLFTWGPVIFFTVWDLGLFTIFENNLIKCTWRTRKKATLCSFVCSVIFLILVVLLGVSIVVWWFVDVVVFSTDGRTDGRGCALL